MDTDESELIGDVTIKEAPKEPPTDERCRGKKKLKRDGETVTNAVGTSMFGGYCRNWPGKGTDHVGEGRCSLHDGTFGTGKDNPNFEHGLFSDVVRPEDRGTLEAIEDMETTAKLESTLNMQVLKLRRAIEGMEDKDRASFLDVFQDMVDGSLGADGELDKQQLMYLAKMLGQNDQAIREWMDLIRKTAKDLHKMQDGETKNVNVGVDSDELGELRDMADDLF